MGKKTMGKTHQVVFASALLIVCTLFSARQIEAQVLYGSIVGDVLDATGSAIPGATVRVTQTDTGQSRTTTTNNTGGYNFSTLPGGPYEVAVTKVGFQTSTSKDVAVAVNNVVRVDVRLQIGAVGQTIEISAQAATLQTDRSEVRGEVTKTDLQNVPVPTGRNYQSLFGTIPGFTPPANQHSVAANPSRGLTSNVNGTTRNANNLRLDGVTSNNIWLPHVPAYVPALEAIE